MNELSQFSPVMPPATDHGQWFLSEERDIDDCKADGNVPAKDLYGTRVDRDRSELREADRDEGSDTSLSSKRQGGHGESVSNSENGMLVTALSQYHLCYSGFISRSCQWVKRVKTDVAAFFVFIRC